MVTARLARLTVWLGVGVLAACAPTPNPGRAAPAAASAAGSGEPQPPATGPSVGSTRAPAVPAQTPAASSASAPDTPPPTADVLAGLPVRPCVVTSTRLPGAAPGGVTLRRVQPEGQPLAVGLGDEPPMRFVYDAKGRVLEGQRGRYVHAPDGTAILTLDGRRTKVAFDARGRLVQDGPTRFEYDPLGRLARATSGRRFVAHEYAKDGTYRVRHNYPDREEFCESDLVEVVRDARGRVASDRYDGCGMNETPNTVRYGYDERDRLVTIEVDLGSNGHADAIVRLEHCP